MKRTLGMILPALLLAALMLPAGSEASARRASAVPYGQPCMGYGAPVQKVNLNSAMESLRAYFSKRGMEVEMIRHNNRFIRADIYKDGMKVDRILLDISTGRMRSLY